MFCDRFACSYDILASAPLEEFHPWQMAPKTTERLDEFGTLSSDYNTLDISHSINEVIPRVNVVPSVEGLGQFNFMLQYSNTSNMGMADKSR
ncbi:hypothetical protein CDAR_440131 [Caerostris darwini]|uniref:Uncharacterized protein n=1 Tax=Caerostris darwini TaxID=1538125 RepID=A0AAV4RJW2_9ARAC|nr:hypothetical protein CDAR_440131 [Caerostris darwini]